MATRKFKVTFSVDYEIDVEVDPEVYNEEWVKGFESYMYNLDDEDEPVMDIAVKLAAYHARFGTDGGFIEGFGHVKRDGQLLSFTEKDAEAAPGLNIIPIQDEFDPYNVEVEEITEP